MEDSRQRRVYRRYPMAAPGFVRDENKGKDSSPIEVSVANISKSGLGIYSVSPLDKGAAITIEIKFRDLNGKEQRDIIKGVVVHSVKVGGLYYSGIIFDEELNSTSQPSLYRHLWKVIIWE